MQGLSGAERLAFRREHAKPWADGIRQACLTVSKQVLLQSAFGKAAALRPGSGEHGARHGAADHSQAAL
jgi:hypothetical protein